MATSYPKGRHGGYVTGQRVPETAYYEDQYGFISHHEAHCTFPPCIGRKGESAERKLVRPAAATA